MAATAESGAALADALGRSHDIAVVLGSGWGDAADAIGPVLAEVATKDVPGMPPPSVAGHSARIRSVALDEQRAALVFLGRTHLYEGRGVHAVAHTVRAAAAHGCRAVILTNGCGAINTAHSPGDVVLVSDHINLTGATALAGPEFVDLTDLYSRRLRDIARDVDSSLAEGVYVQFHGPQYETPAEVVMSRIIGGSLVGMSTVLEAIAASHLGMRILGLSLATNLAAGLGEGRLDGDHVVAVAEANAPYVASLLHRIITTLAARRELVA